MNNSSNIEILHRENLTLKRKLARVQKRLDEITEFAFEREQFFSIFDSIDESIYVSDPSRFIVLFANKTLQASLGKDPTGFLCFKELHGFDSPCPFCTNPLILQDKAKPYKWEFYNQATNRNYMIFDRIIRWPDNRDARFELAIDITDRKQIEKKLRASLREKEVLLREIHHRVKNNLQVVSSLLSLQAQQVTDAAVRDMFRESQRRIRSMALVHEKLYQSSDFSRINFSDYLQNLVVHLSYSYQIDRSQIDVQVSADQIPLNINTAIPCGLIINELVSNSLKHAFPGGRRGSIIIELKQGPDSQLFLRVRDDGIGLPEGFNYRNAKSLGMQIVTTLVHQINGKMEVPRSGKGAEFRISFGEIKTKAKA